VVEALTTIGNTNKGLNSSIACNGYDNYKIPPIAGKEFWDMIHLEYELIENSDISRLALKIVVMTKLIMNLLS
jgi:hypothetical protein